ncbi:hypothetical protein [Zunongwangia profunda]|uniref:hypothetical protein n=1 Tax=Zunongwangia profunda TaxID=398743 RepID=UPI001D1947D8|nr:hypothetical protein [Zunongwangia profunda]MCC4227630.1 hypothetical protein [Zunongwangia profunda]|tara:strand:+ start:165 stop:539 length:375 start_codon:yes stop_codon:yes gene_type:complete
MYSVRNNKILHYFSLFIGLVILNISVDSPDINKKWPEDLSLNDQESIVEIVLEKIMGFENAIPEYEDSDNESHLIKKHFSVDLYVLDKKSEFVFDVALQKLINSEYKFKYYDFYPETTSPPPEI